MIIFDHILSSRFKNGLYVWKFWAEISCSKCKNYILVGVNSGVCEINNYEDTMSSESCEKFEKIKTNKN